MSRRYKLSMIHYFTFNTRLCGWAEAQPHNLTNPFRLRIPYRTFRMSYFFFGSRFSRNVKFSMT